MKRVATALVLIPAVVWLVLKGPYWALIVAFTVVGSMGFWEFDRMAVKCGSIGTALYGMIAGVVLLHEIESTLGRVRLGDNPAVGT
jgi:CDP-diglyceride synthetase